MFRFKVSSQVSRNRVLHSFFQFAILAITTLSMLGQPASFGAATTYSRPLYSFPIHVAIDDFNNDGNRDLVVANFSAHNVSVYLGNGSGTFGGSVDYAVGTNPRSVAVGDINGDGIKDLTVSRNSGSISILLGTGTGAFGPLTSVAGGTSNGSVTLCDLNGDGIKDLVSSDFGDQSIAVILGLGGGFFGSASIIPIGGGNGPGAIAVGDFNSDSKPDIAVTLFFSNHVAIFLGAGDGTFGAATLYPTLGNNPASVATADFNGDGRLDLAVVNTGGNNLAVHMGTGTGSFGSATLFNTGLTQPISLALADFNGDSKLDVAVANQGTGTLSIFRGTGTGSFIAPDLFPTASNDARGIAIGDINNDGNPDVAIANAGSYAAANISVLLNTAGPPPDITPPVVTPQLSAAPNAFGWHRSPITVSWVITEVESTIASTTGCAPVVISADTGLAGITLTCTATNSAGLAGSANVTVKMDATPPVLLSTRLPLANPAGWNNTSVSVGFSCTDSLSGMIGYVPSTVVLASEGASQSAAFSCQDFAGNTSTGAVTNINIDKTAPVVGVVSLAPASIAITAASTLSIAATDSGSGGLASIDYRVDGGIPVSLLASGFASTQTAGVGPFATAGVREYCAISRDVAGNVSGEGCALLAVYDPNGGFVKIGRAHV